MILVDWGKGCFCRTQRKPTKLRPLIERFVRTARELDTRQHCASVKLSAEVTPKGFPTKARLRFLAELSVTVFTGENYLFLAAQERILYSTIALWALAVFPFCTMVSLHSVDSSRSSRQR